jgi:hypothetical protein
MASTYEMIKALPGKGTDWRRLASDLRDHYVSLYTANHGVAPWGGGSLAQWDAAKGVRELRQAAMEAACFAVDEASRRSAFIAPSPETLEWGGFLGGSTEVWTDQDAERAATAEIAGIIARAG